MYINKRRLKIKKILTIMLIGALAIALIAGCTPTETVDDPAAFAKTTDITVVSREDGSGTRGAFVDLIGILQEDAKGNDIDRTSIDADISNSTAAVMAFCDIGMASRELKSSELEAGLSPIVM